jgi:hypothetical protein
MTFKKSARQSSPRTSPVIGRVSSGLSTTSGSAIWNRGCVFPELLKALSVASVLPATRNLELSASTSASCSEASSTGRCFVLTNGLLSGPHTTRLKPRCKPRQPDGDAGRGRMGDTETRRHGRSPRPYFSTSLTRTTRRCSMKRSTLQHRYNALNLYCRLCPYLGRRLARLLASSWEHTRIYRALYLPPVAHSDWG